MTYQIPSMEEKDMTYTTTIPHHEYKEEALHYGIWVSNGWYGTEIYPDKVGCLCGKPKEDRIHKPIRVDSW